MNVILDMDVGIDDAVALAWAYRCPSLHITAITTVGGNIPVEQSTRNTLDWLHYLGANEIPVYRGLDGPLFHSGNVHGKNGLGDVTLPSSPKQVEVLPAPQFLVEAACKQPSPTLVATGPLTNLAEAIRLNPEAMTNFADIVIMGGAVPLPGAAATGNVTPNVEFNFGCDPESAQTVFQWAASHQFTITMIGLNVTEHVHMLPADIELISQVGGKLGSQLAQMVQPIMRFYEETNRGYVFVPHDAIAMMQVFHPYCETTIGHIQVSHAGQSIFTTDRLPHNARVAQSIQSAELMQNMLTVLFPGHEEKIANHFRLAM